MKRKILLVISIISIAIFMCACGGKNNATPQTNKGFFPSGSAVGSSFGSSFFEGSSSASVDFFGEAVSFSVMNTTGYSIDSMIIRNSVTEDEIVLVTEEKPFLNWEEQNFFCPMLGEEDLPEDFDGTVEYSAEIGLTNGSKFLLHDFPLGKTVKMLVVYEKNIGYLIYENLKNNKMISTLDTESVLSKQNVVNAGSGYGEIQDPYSDYYQNPYADYDQPPVFEEPDLENMPVSGSKDGCLDGGLFW